MDIKREYALIQKEINKLTEMKKPYNPNMRKRQIQILQQLDDEFVKSENIKAYTIRIRFNSMMKFFAEELGLPVEKYVENLKLLSRKMGEIKKIAKPLSKI